MPPEARFEDHEVEDCRWDGEQRNGYVGSGVGWVGGGTGWRFNGGGETYGMSTYDERHAGGFESRPDEERDPAHPSHWFNDLGAAGYENGIDRGINHIGYESARLRFGKRHHLPSDIFDGGTKPWYGHKAGRSRGHSNPDSSDYGSEAYVYCPSPSTRNHRTTAEELIDPSVVLSTSTSEDNEFPMADWYSDDDSQARTNIEEDDVETEEDYAPPSGWTNENKESNLASTLPPLDQRCETVADEETDLDVIGTKDANQRLTALDRSSEERNSHSITQGPSSHVSSGSARSHSQHPSPYPLPPSTPRNPNSRKVGGPDRRTNRPPHDTSTRHTYSHLPISPAHLESQVRQVRKAWKAIRSERKTLLRERARLHMEEQNLKEAWRQMAEGQENIEKCRYRHLQGLSRGYFPPGRSGFGSDDGYSADGHGHMCGDVGEVVDDLVGSFGTPVSSRMVAVELEDCERASSIAGRGLCEPWSEAELGYW